MSVNPSILCSLGATRTCAPSSSKHGRKRIFPLTSPPPTQGARSEGTVFSIKGSRRQKSLFCHTSELMSWGIQDFPFMHYLNSGVWQLLGRVCKLWLYYWVQHKDVLKKKQNSAPGGYSQQEAATSFGELVVFPCLTTPACPGSWLKRACRSGSSRVWSGTPFLSN